MKKLPDFNDHIKAGGGIPDMVEASDPWPDEAEGESEDAGDDFSNYVASDERRQKTKVVWRSGDLTGYVAEVERILVRSGVRCYAYGDSIAVVVWHAADSRPAHIVMLDQDRMVYLLAATIRWFRIIFTKGGGEQEVPSDPPPIVARQVLAHDHRRLPVLKALAHVPVLLPTGRLVANPGFDDESGYFAAFQLERFTQLKTNPSRADAAEAMRHLLELFDDFYFEHPAGRYAAVAAVLTLTCRSAIEGAVPMVLVTASTPGTGKSLLVSVITAIGSGKEAARMAQTDDTEMEKRITAALAAGFEAMVIDNARDTIGCPSLDAYLTTTGDWQGRILGESRPVNLPARAVVFGTGNNLKLAGDLQRRVLPISLLAKQERPEERQDFKIKDLLGHVVESRDRLAIAAITILHAYILSPEKVDPPMLGSYGNWSRLVRGAVIWAGGLDPVATREQLVAESDDVKIAWGELLVLLRAKFGPEAFVAADVAQFLGGHDNIRDVLLGEKAADGKSVGQVFKRWKGRIVGTLSLEVTALKTGGLKHWVVVDVAATDAGSQPS